nr:MAG TPA: PgaD-like protein [Caudoviricetes sp.]
MSFIISFIISSFVIINVLLLIGWVLYNRFLYPITIIIYKYLYKILQIH